MLEKQGGEGPSLGVVRRGSGSTDASKVAKPWGGTRLSCSKAAVLSVDPRLWDSHHGPGFETLLPMSGVQRCSEKGAPVVDGTVRLRRLRRAAKLGRAAERSPDLGLVLGLLWS